ncbi:MAG: exodeoxyribonuclease VII large subunit [Phycisphaerae bacterium]|nr:exodeoxyribonuclease VII large subunit [Phycisphaerae bacterium]
MARKRKTLFDPAGVQGPRDDSRRGAAGAGNAPPGAISVSALVERIKSALAEALPERFCVVGEISNLSAPASGHLYFNLKDSSAAIAAAMWRSQAERLKFRPADGLEVVVEGRVDVYDVQGRLQLYVERMTPRGQGALELAFRQLKDKLQAEGLFDPARKKAVARFPRAVGVITSATGAAVRDVQRTLRRRWPAASVYLLPVPVQGEGSAEKIAEAVRLMDAGARKLGIDTILLVRGGGSLEDLWAFNEEVLARAVAASQTPIISGVGHEVDVTICDLAADVRAATPTAAAELAVPDREEIRRHVEHLAMRLRRNLLEAVSSARGALNGLLRSAAFRDPAGRVRNGMQRIDELAHRLRWVLAAAGKRAGDRLEAIRRRLDKADPAHSLRLAHQRVDAFARQLEAMSYRNVLRRGFSVTRDPGGRLLRSVADVHPAHRVQTELADGMFYSDVTDVEETTARNDKSDTTRKEQSDPQAKNEISRRSTKQKMKRASKNSGPTLFD